jgi:hypothetical protein
MRGALSANAISNVVGAPEWCFGPGTLKPSPCSSPRCSVRRSVPRRASAIRAPSPSPSSTASAQIHVASGRTVAAYSRRALSLLGHAGLAWLRDGLWPRGSAVLDGEVCVDTGSAGLQAVLEARGRRGGMTCFVGFDVLRVNGHEVTREHGATAARAPGHRRGHRFAAGCGRARVGRSGAGRSGSARKAAKASCARIAAPPTASGERRAADRDVAPRPFGSQRSMSSARPPAARRAFPCTADSEVEHSSVE